MSKKEKAIKRIKSLPKDYSFMELIALLRYFGYSINNKGKTSESRVEFLNNNSRIELHKPHDRKYLLREEIKEIIRELERRGYI